MYRLSNNWKFSEEHNFWDFIEIIRSEFASGEFYFLRLFQAHSTASPSRNNFQRNQKSQNSKQQWKLKSLTISLKTLMEHE